MSTSDWWCVFFFVHMSIFDPVMKDQVSNVSKSTFFYLNVRVSKAINGGKVKRLQACSTNSENNDALFWYLDGIFVMSMRKNGLISGLRMSCFLVLNLEFMVLLRA